MCKVLHLSGEVREFGAMKVCFRVIEAFNSVQRATKADSEGIKIISA